MIGFDVLDELGRFAAVSRAHGDAGLPIPPPADEARVREGIRAYVARHPIYREYMRVRKAGGEDFRNTEPWMAIGEQLQAAVTMAFANSDEAEGQVTANVERPYMLSLALWALQATPYLWSAATRDVAVRAPLPKHTISRDVLPFPCMFWSMETSYGAAGGSEPDQAGDFNWFFILHNGDRVTVVHDLTQDDLEHLHVYVAGIPYGGAWPHDIPEGAQHGTGHILKMSSFLASPLVVKAGMPLSRPLRRELRRAGYPPPVRDELVNVVRLRRVEYPASDGGGESDVQWAHQWWVSGHFRAQWYPSLQAHKVIWIAPHLKGPGDKPLLEKAYAVVR